MNLEHAKARRLAALQTCNSDRVLVAPAANEAELSLPERGTLAAYIIGALDKGYSVERFMAENGWSKGRAMANIYRVAKKTGVGIQRSNNKLCLVRPVSDPPSILEGEIVSETASVCAD
jgi:hypothetical protein